MLTFIDLPAVAFLLGLAGLFISVRAAIRCAGLLKDLDSKSKKMAWDLEVLQRHVVDLEKSLKAKSDTPTIDSLTAELKQLQETKERARAAHDAFTARQQQAAAMQQQAAQNSQAGAYFQVGGGGIGNWRDPGYFDPR